MYVIGLCGTTGSGKSLVSNFFKERGIPCINADEVYKELLYPNSPLIRKLSSEFGAEIITKSGELDRKKLASIVFSESGRESSLPRLNAIAHAAVIAETERRIRDFEDSGISAVIFDAPQLFESGFNQKCDFILGVGADRSTRISRIMKRDGISEDEAMLRISSQMSDTFFAENCDAFVENNTTAQELYEKIKIIYENIKKEI